jgi:hypothetical protein
MRAVGIGHGLVGALLALCASTGCGRGDEAAGPGPGTTPAAGAVSCPANAQAPKPVPRTGAEHERLDYWLSRRPAAELDAPLMSVEDIDAYDRGVGHAGEIYSQRDLSQPVERRRVERDLTERLEYLRERLADGRLVDAEGKKPDIAALDLPLPALAPELRVALGPVPLRCGPMPFALHDGKPAPSTRYDRNACSTARDQEVIEILAPWPNGMRLARTRYALGFVAADAVLSPVLPKALVPAFVNGPYGVVGAEVAVGGETGGAARMLSKGTRVPLADDHALIATLGGVARRPVAQLALTPTRRPLTRRALWTEAFSLLGSPYGFGDAGGGRDCSRLLLDVLERFDVALPRHSAWQAQAGRYTVDVRGKSDADKLAQLDQADRSGIVLLAFPGHIMLYVGRDAEGGPRVLHALGEYVQPCSGGTGETVMQVERTLVSDLSLGKGSSRRSLLERVATLVVFGAPPAAAEANAPSRVHVHALPPAAPPDGECRDSTEARIWVSPARPVAGQPMRVIATASQRLSAPSLWLYAPDGSFVRADRHRLGGPPWSVWSRVDAPRDGRYVAVLVDGERVLGCKPLPVRGDPLASEAAAAGAPVWMPRFRWEADTLNLWSAFVEQLFDDPPDDERTWTDLHSLLQDPSRNLLLDHLGQGEDARLTIVPDCADLPFALRAYFAWKLRLPFAYRQCSRGRPGVPPRCGLVRDHLMPREGGGEVEAFSVFVNRRVRSGVHSATGRTHPEDDATDLYPVALERASLPPGTVYADPYGHVMMLTKWFAQGPGDDEYGILIAAEAQPDNTIGRRRFFAGSFLFDPSTRDVGAGWKQFRPLIAERGAAPAPEGEPAAVASSQSAAGFQLVPLTNAELAKSSVFAPFSLQQYQGTKDDFYERMDALINPSPLDPHTRLRSLLDALEEAAKRRVLAVDTGEAYMRDHRGVVPMPSGHDVFETTGPWEDYATPSRDMRLLIALDTVLALPARMQSRPERFRLPAGQSAEQARAALERELTEELGKRRFEYTRSDGAKQALTLADLRARATALELGYNPNDCVERRWGAAEGSAELASCGRRAPAEQQKRMERYREWFRTRTRPAREGGE